jgi:hypothetical protein
MLFKIDELSDVDDGLLEDLVDVAEVDDDEVDDERVVSDVWDVDKVDECEVVEVEVEEAVEVLFWRLDRSTIPIPAI